MQIIITCPALSKAFIRVKILYLEPPLTLQHFGWISTQAVDSSDVGAGEVLQQSNGK